MSVATAKRGFGPLMLLGVIAAVVFVLPRAGQSQDEPAAEATGADARLELERRVALAKIDVEIHRQRIVIAEAERNVFVLAVSPAQARLEAFGQRLEQQEANLDRAQKLANDPQGLVGFMTLRRAEAEVSEAKAKRSEAERELTRAKAEIAVADAKTDLLRLELKAAETRLEYLMRRAG